MSGAQFARAAAKSIASAEQVAGLIREGLPPKQAFRRVATAEGVKPAAIAQRYYTMTRSGLVERPPLPSNGNRAMSTLADRVDDLAALVWRLADEVRELEADAARARLARVLLNGAAG